MNYTFTARSEQDLPNIAKEVLTLCKEHSIFAFFGEMGAGKTTFIRSLCDELQVTDTVNSPTFAIINDYETKDNNLVYHFDFYRVKNIEEAYNFGYETYFDSGNICLIEWPQIIEDLIVDNFLKIIITVDDENKRTITVE